jgi:hypothetical protein
VRVEVIVSTVKGQVRGPRVGVDGGVGSKKEVEGREGEGGGEGKACEKGHGRDVREQGLSDLQEREGGPKALEPTEEDLV